MRESTLASLREENPISISMDFGSEIALVGAAGAASYSVKSMSLVSVEVASWTESFRFIGAIFLEM